MQNQNESKGKMRWVFIAMPTLAIILGCGIVFWFLFGQGEDGARSVSGSAIETTTEGSGSVENGDSDASAGQSDDTAGGGAVQGDTVMVMGTSVLNTGNLTETGNGYEGIPGTGDYNYGEALQKSLLFYELQRSGDLPEEVRCNWRGDSGLTDGSDVGLDLTGGWYDAGDHVKFNLPMAYSATMLAWSLYEDPDAYEESGQLTYALSNIRWANEYFIRCHPEDEVYYYQVGDGGIDHSWWGPAEVMQMQRPSYCVTADAPGSTVCGGTAASLAACSIVFEETDGAFSAECLSHAISLYEFAASTMSDAGYTKAAGFYDSHSGFYDELAWAATWLYLATGEESYLAEAEEYYPQACQDYNWAHCWDDVHIGTALMLARITEESVYSDAVELHLDYWTVGTESGERITYTPQGLAWLDGWGALRYATTTAYIASVYSEWEGCPSDKVDIYWDFAVSQAGYALGDTGFSYLIGFGENHPENPHHRTAQGSYCNNMNEPSEARHTLYGALVGGPGSSDDYIDEVSNYNTNEVACDYNAGFTGLMAKLYTRYHGETLVDFGAVEPITINELYVDGGINVEGTDFVEIKAYVYNVSAWPARVPENLELRYFVDLSEVYAAGKTAADIEITTNYMQAGAAAGLHVWDEENHIYYLSIDFTDALIYPGGQDNYKKEIQVRMRNPEGTWDNSNDPSFAGLASGSVALATGMGLYENGVLVFGSEPAAGENAGSVVVGQTGANAGSASGDNSGDGGNAGAGGNAPQNATATNEEVSVSIDYSNMQSSSTSISGTLTVRNESDGSLDLGDMTIRYYFTNENGSALSFACYHAALNGANGSYSSLSGVTGEFSDCDGDNADTLCEISFGSAGLLEEGGEVSINFCINHSDWSAFTTSNDYSGESAEHIVICIGEDVIFGEKP